MKVAGKPQLLTLPILFLLQLSYAQQWYLSTVPFNKSVNAAFVFNRNSVILAGGDTAYSTHDIFKSKDLGASWTIELDQYQSWLKSIAFHDTSTGYAVGDNGLVLKTTNGGVGWGPTNSPGNFGLNKVLCTSGSTTFVFGGNTNIESVIFKSVDAGNTWILLDSAPGACLRSAFFLNAQKGFAVGDSALILMTTDSGNTWSRVTAPVARNFSSITFINTDTGFIVGGSAADSIRSILMTKNAGLNWTVVKDEPGNCFTDISFADGQNGFAVGDKANIFKSTNGGLTWVSSSVNGANNTDYFTCVKYFDPAFAVIGSQAGRAFVYTNTPTPIINTVGENYIDSADVSINATLNTQGTPTACFVQYGTDSTFTVNTATYNVYVTNDTPTFVTIFLHYLTPYQTYYYRPVAYSILGNIYGQTKSFFTVLPYYTYHTDSATGINPISATLNATVSGFPFPIYSYFDYDTTPNPASVNRMYPAPDIINDTLTHFLSVTATNLIPGRTYYFRWGASGQSFGNFLGSIQSFHTPLTFTNYYHTDTATSLSPGSVVLNATISGFHFPINSYFDYDTTPAFSSPLRITSIPALINDALTYHLTATVSNLIPGATYYYRWIGDGQTFGIFTGNMQSFSLPHNGANYAYITLQTRLVTILTDSTAYFNGLVSGLHTAATVFFDYGPTLSFGNYVTGTPYYITDSLSHSVLGFAYGLHPEELYYCRLVLQIHDSVYFADTILFNTTAGMTVLPASGVSTTSAQLNGMLHFLPQTSGLKFEYGTDTLFANSVSAVPDSIGDTAAYYVTAPIGNLTPNTFYYYRLKGTIHGFDILSNVEQLYTGSDEILNWDFQNWEYNTLPLPHYWKVIGKNIAQVPGHSGTYAAKIYGLNALMLGAFEDSGTPHGGPIFYGGQAFHYRPDSVIAFLNYDLASGDSGNFYVQLYGNGVIESAQFFKFGGNSGGAFQRLAFPLTYNSAQTPDSLVLVITSHDFFSSGSGQSGNNFVIVDDISFASGGPVENGGFENWYNYDFERLQSWWYAAYFNADPYLANTTVGPMVTKVVHSYPDDYAAEIRSLDLEGKIYGGQLTSSSQPLTQDLPSFPVSVRHQTFNGYYKFFPANHDTMSINVFLYKNGQPIGTAFFTQADSVPDYTAFSFPIRYEGPDSLTTPDSGCINIRSYFTKARGLSRIDIDKLSFDGFVNSIPDRNSNPIDQNSVELFPNPAEDHVTVISFEGTGNLFYTIYDVTGHRVLTASTDAVPSGKSIKYLDVAALSSGIYFVHVQTIKTSFVQKLVISK